MKQLGIIIVTYQSERYIAPLLRSLADTIDPAETVIWVFDNASKDETVTIAEREKWELNLPVRILRSETNFGFMRGNNEAFAALRAETPCVNIALLNPDTVAHPGWWEPLLAELENPNVGTVAPLLLLPDGTVNSRGNALHFLGLGFVRGYGEAAADCPANPTIFSGSGAALAFRTATLDAMNARLGLEGIFWEDLFLYSDDTDFGWQMRMVGLENRLVPECRVTHDHRFWLTPLETAGFRLFQIERNRYLLMISNYKMATLILLLPWIAASELALGLRLWKLYPHRFHLWCGVWKEIRKPAFWSRRSKIQAGRTVGDRTVLRAMTGSLRHGALPFGPMARALDLVSRASHRLLCLIIWW